MEAPELKNKIHHVTIDGINYYDERSILKLINQIEKRVEMINLKRDGVTVELIENDTLPRYTAKLIVHSNIKHLFEV